MGPERPPPSVGLIGTIGWLRLLFMSQLLLATLAAALEILLVPSYSGRFPSAALVLWAVVAIAVFGVWPVRLAATLGWARSRWEASRVARTWAIVTFGLGLVGFLAGIMTLPYAFPVFEGGYLGWYEWEYILFGAWFPFVPSVFAPVVLSEAGFAFLASGSFQDAQARWRLRSAAWLLLAVTISSIAIQVFDAFHGWWWGLVGLLTPGFLLAAAGAAREFRARTTGALARGPAAPSPGSSP